MCIVLSARIVIVTCPGLVWAEIILWAAYYSYFLRKKTSAGFPIKTYEWHDGCLEENKNQMLKRDQISIKIKKGFPP